MVNIPKASHERTISACDKIHENVLQALRFWSVFEELNGKSANERANLRNAIATTAYGAEAVTTIKTMVAQTTILALWRILDEPNADVLGAAVIRTALTNGEVKKARKNSAADGTAVYESGPGTASPYTSLVKRLRRLPKITKRLKPLRDYCLAHSIDKPYGQLRIRNIRLCLIYCVKLSRDANLLLKGARVSYPVYIDHKRREAGFFWDCFESGLKFQKRQKREKAALRRDAARTKARSGIRDSVIPNPVD